MFKLKVTNNIDGILVVFQKKGNAALVEVVLIILGLLLLIAACFACAYNLLHQTRDYSLPAIVFIAATLIFAKVPHSLS